MSYSSTLVDKEPIFIILYNYKYVNKTNEKLNWSIFDKEKFIFDDSSATRILIKVIGSNRSNILGS